MRVLVREKEKGKELAEEGEEVEEGELEVLESIDEEMAGVSAVVLVSLAAHATS